MSGLGEERACMKRGLVRGPVGGGVCINMEGVDVEGRE